MEGRTPGGTIEAIHRELPTDIANALILFRDTFRDKMFVSCWHENAFESSTMWGAFADGYRGVAVKTTARNLRESIKGPESCVLARVQYVDFATHSGQNDIKAILLLKRREFSGESEVRLIHTVEIRSGLLSEKGQPDEREGIFVNVSLSDLITEIVVGPHADIQVEDHVRKLAAQVNKVSCCRRSYLYA
jgi:hypothetical protein